MVKYIKHPKIVPISYQTNNEKKSPEYLTDNLNLYGIIFEAEQYLAAGSSLKIKIHIINAEFNTSGTVMQCNKESNGYHIALLPNSKKNSFELRMIEQLCHIEEYRSNILKKENRILSHNAAAVEWIAKYAEKFAH